MSTAIAIAMLMLIQIISSLMPLVDFPVTKKRYRVAEAQALND